MTLRRNPGHHPTIAVVPIALGLLAAAIAIAFAGLRPDWIVTHRRSVLALAAASLVASLAFLVRTDPVGLKIALDPSEEPMIPSGDPMVADYEAAVATFGDDDVYVIALETEDVFTVAHLSALDEIGVEIRRLPGVRRVESLADTISYSYDAGTDTVEVGPLVDEIPTEPAELARLRERALGDRMYPRTLVSADGRTAAVNVFFQPMTDGEFIAAGLDQSIREIVARHAQTDRRFHVSGRQHIKAEAYRLMASDLERLVPIAVAVGASVAWLFTGSLRMAVIPVGASLMATCWVFALLAAFDHPVNLITVVLGPMLICVGSVYGVHVLARFDLEAADSACPAPPAAAAAALRYAFTPVVVAGATTCVGFAALAWSDARAVTEMGMLSLLGVAYATAVSLTVVPALLAALPPTATIEQRRRRVAVAFETTLTAIARVTTARSLGLIATWGALTAGAVALIPQIRVDTDYLTFFNRRSQVRSDFAAISDKLVGAVPIYVTLDGGEEGAFRDPANLRALADLQEEVGRLPGVSTTLSLVDLIETLNRAFEKGDPAKERIPDTRGAVSDLLFLIPKDRLRSFASANHSTVNLLVRTAHSGSADILALERQLLAAIDAAGLPPGIETRVTGKAILVNHVADGIAANQLLTVSAASLAILALMSWVFRSLTAGALAMVPNLAPVALFYGILGAGIASLSLPTSMIGCMALGIAIDDTAHFVVGYRRRRQAGLDPRASASECVRQLGRPIALTSFMLVAGFSMMSMSEFATLRQFGLLTAATMGICLAADLLLLPALLVRSRA